LCISSIIALERAISVIARNLTAERIPDSCLERDVEWTSAERQ
jgi:hypothetical protein